MRNLGWPELLGILVVIVLLFGARKLPDLARALGKSIAEFKKGRDEATKSESADSGRKQDGN